MPSHSHDGCPCRLESVPAVLANTALDDPLENAEQLADQMDSLPFIFRFEYEEMNQYFCSLMDPIVAAHSRGLVSGDISLPQKQSVLVSSSSPCYCSSLAANMEMLTWALHVLAVAYAAKSSNACSCMTCSLQNSI